MSNSINLQFNAFPSVVKMYPKMMLSKKPSLVKEGKSYKRIQASIQNVTAQPGHVNQFAEVCSFQKNAEYLPLPYPHILAAPLHYSILNHSEFPVKLLGLVHVANSITQHRPIGLQEVMTIECHIEDFDNSPRGQTFHLHTVITVDGETVWEETCSFLARKKSKTSNKTKTASAKPAESDSDPGTEITSWEIPGNMGRQFAKVSGDVNPIHMSNLTAKLFGFKQAIIHGVWSMSRTMAELEPDLLKQHGLSGITMQVNFKLPAFIPCWVTLHKNKTERGLNFVMKDSAGEKPHMSGSISYI
jgi:acyl dehydratase